MCLRSNLGVKKLIFLFLFFLLIARFLWSYHAIVLHVSSNFMEVSTRDVIQGCDEIKVTTVQFSKVSWSSGRDLYSQLQELWKRSLKYLLFRVCCLFFFIHHRIQGQISTQRERSFSFFINPSVYSDKYNQSLLFSYCTGSAVWKLGISFKCKSVRNKKDSIYGSVLKYYYIITHILNHLSFKRWKVRNSSSTV